MAVKMTGFERFDDKTFHAVLDAGIENPNVLEAVIREAGRRSGVEHDKVRELLRTFVHQCLNDVGAVHDQLFALFWDDPTVGRQEYLKLVGEYSGGGNLSWPWPLTEPLASRGGSSARFPRERSGLYICGYRASKKDGLPDNERKNLLEYFFRNNLPEIVSRYHGDDYGPPESDKRLRKMANVLATHCQNRKRDNRLKYKVAIMRYEKDLEYLRKTFYHANMFPWPPTEP